MVEKLSSCILKRKLPSTAILSLACRGTQEPCRNVREAWERTQGGRALRKGACVRTSVPRWERNNYRHSPRRLGYREMQLEAPALYIVRSAFFSRLFSAFCYCFLMLARSPFCHESPFKHRASSQHTISLSVCLGAFVRFYAHFQPQNGPFRPISDENDAFFVGFCCFFEFSSFSVTFVEKDGPGSPVASVEHDRAKSGGAGVRR